MNYSLIGIGLSSLLFFNMDVGASSIVTLIKHHPVETAGAAGGAIVVIGVGSKVIHALVSGDQEESPISNIRVIDTGQEGEVPELDRRLINKYSISEEGGSGSVVKKRSQTAGKRASDTAENERVTESLTKRKAVLSEREQLQQEQRKVEQLEDQSVDARQQAGGITKAVDTSQAGTDSTITSEGDDFGDDFGDDVEGLFE